MTPLIAMPGPVLPETGSNAPADAALPVLPVLTRMLHAARRLPASDGWRNGVMRACLGGQDACEPAAIAARAVEGLPADVSLCMASPLHVVPGISRVHLPPGGRLAYPIGQAATWCDAFNREFGSDSLRLHMAGSGWLLQAPFAHAARDPDPALLAGLPLQRQPARDEHERALRRLGTEVEMWLAEHPLHGADGVQRQPPANMFWFWAGGRARSLPAPVCSFPHVASPWDADAWTRGLAVHLGATVHEGVAAWPDTPPDSLVLLAPPSDVAPHEYWTDVEARWLEPAWRALGEGRIAGLRLQIGDSAWSLPARSPWRWLRRRRDWPSMVRS